MEYLNHGLTLETGPDCFPLSTDSMLLAHFVRLPRQARVLDLGAGCGTLGLLLCAKSEHCQVTGVEIDEKAHLLALENIRRNQLSARMESLCADLREVSGDLVPGSFDICVSNPPYFAAGPASKANATARREDLCNAEDLLRTASRALKYGGDLYLVHRPERLGQLIAIGAAYHMEAKRMALVRHRPESPASILLLQLRKGGRPGLILEEYCLHHADGTPTPYYKEVYHLD